MTKLEDIKKEYEKISRIAKLPRFEDIDEMFEIRAIDLEKDGILLNAIVRRINNEINSYLSFLSLVANPSPNSLYSIVPLNYLDEKTKEEITRHHAKLTMIYYSGLEILLMDEKGKIKFIQDTCSFVKEFRNMLAKFVRATAKAWESSSKEHNEKKWGFLP